MIITDIREQVAIIASLAATAINLERSNDPKDRAHAALCAGVVKRHAIAVLAAGMTAGVRYGS